MSSSCRTQSDVTYVINKKDLIEDLDQMLSDLDSSYIYTSEKNIDFQCIHDHYKAEVDKIESEEDEVLLFEYLIDEFYDSHLILNTNRNSSYRLYAPIYVSYRDAKIIVDNVWTSQIAELNHEIIDAEVLSLNGVAIDKVIESFPTACHDKSQVEIREWIANKVIAGRYNESRILKLQLADKSIIELNIDSIRIKESDAKLSIVIEDNIAIIRINNALGDNSLISEFDKAIDSAMDTKALILDLRNTVAGGNSYVAKGIMSRFINKAAGYQKHRSIEQYGEGPQVERSWIEYVSPRLTHYDKPVTVLVGRWTGSMGEGLAIGMDAIRETDIMGTEMERLVGGMYYFPFQHRKYGYRLSLEKIFHIDGTPRENYIPELYNRQFSNLNDELLLRALEKHRS